MDTYQIEKDVSIPSVLGRGRTPSMAMVTLRQMGVGDSFLVPCADGERRIVQTNIVGSAKRVGIRTTTRSVAGGLRVWRLADVELPKE
jgi:hypothetical protein